MLGRMAHDTKILQLMFRALNFLHAAEGYIELDYSNSFCPLGCCRLVCFRKEPLERQMPKRVRMLNSDFHGSQALDVNSMTYLVGECVRRTKMSIKQLEDTFGFVVDGEDIWEAYLPEAKLAQE